MEAGGEVEGETVAKGELNGREAQVDHRLQNRYQGKLPVRSAQWRQQRPSDNGVASKPESGGILNLRRTENGVLPPTVLGRPAGARRSPRRPENGVLPPTALGRPAGVRRNLR